MENYKVYVEVTVKFSTDGVMMPVEFIWEDGTKYIIDKVKSKERCASRKAGGTVGLQSFANRNVLQGQRAGKTVLVIVGNRLFHIIAGGFGIGAAHRQFKILRDLFLLGHTALHRLRNAP